VFKGVAAGQAGAMNDIAALMANLGLASLMVALTVTVHFFGLLGLLHMLRGRGHRFKAHQSIAGQGGLILFVVFGIFAIHTVEIWLYAIVFEALGEFKTFETALYFSTVTFASLGYGDVQMSEKWRLFGSIEAANGMILFAWSTAFLLSIMGRLRVLEHDWLDPGQDP
jgi:hypothetical protein